MLYLSTQNLGVSKISNPHLVDIDGGNLVRSAMPLLISIDSFSSPIQPWKYRARERIGLAPSNNLIEFRAKLLVNEDCTLRLELVSPWKLDFVHVPNSLLLFFRLYGFIYKFHASDLRLVSI